MTTDITPSPDALILRSNRLAVELALPGRVYRGSRFDWSGFITQVTLDEQHTYCMPESLKPGAGSGGAGLCNEFGIDQPVGYDDARPGELFPKLGIGLLKRPDDALYSFGRPYEVAQAFTTQVTADADRARVTVEPLDCRGYAARLDKTMTVAGNMLRIDYRLENTGRQPIVTHEYAHNFVGINRQPIGPAYRLSLPRPIQVETPPGLIGDLAVDGSTFRLGRAPADGFYSRVLGSTRTAQPQWELIHLPSGRAMREYDDFAPVRVAVWGTAHVISAEIFAGIHLRPGETQTWSRQYEFL